MKRVPLIPFITSTTLFALIACNTQEPTPAVATEPPPPAPLAEFDSLLGTWVDTTNSGKYTSFEEWTKTNDSLLTGLGCAVSAKGDTVFLENLTIAKHGGVVGYSA